jgi:hypothetical protein
MYPGFLSMMPGHRRGPGKNQIEERFVKFIQGISMPELPEVESFRKYFEATSLHDPVAGIEVKSPGILRNISEHELRSRLVGKNSPRYRGGASTFMPPSGGINPY